MITIGIDVGGTKVLAVAVSSDAPAVVLAEHRVPTPDGGVGLVPLLGEVVHHLAGEVGPPAAVGVGVPGLVDRSGVLHVGAHLRHVSELPLAALLGEVVACPAVVDNDANAAAVAEHRAGAAAGSSDALVVTFGTGIGAGIVTGGTLLRGARGFAGEPGHMVVVPDGPPCPCGRRGCWERFASGTGLGRLARDAAEAGRLDDAVARAGGDPEMVRGEHVTASARAGDEASVALLDELAWWIGLGLANLTNILDPEVIVIGGGLVDAADLLLEGVRTHVAELAMRVDRQPPLAIVAAHLGEQAGAIGAALLAADHLG